jgi:hypothetical protein
MIKHETPPLACRPHGYLMARRRDITNIRRRLSTRSWCLPPSRGRYVAGRQSLRQRHRQSGSRGPAANMPAAARPPDRSSTDRVRQPIRSAITVAGIRGNARNSSGSGARTHPPAAPLQHGDTSAARRWPATSLPCSANSRPLGRARHPQTSDGSEPNPPRSAPASALARLPPGSRGKLVKFQLPHRGQYSAASTPATASVPAMP